MDIRSYFGGKSSDPPSAKKTVSKPAAKSSAKKTEEKGKGRKKRVIESDEEEEEEPSPKPVAKPTPKPQKAEPELKATDASAYFGSNKISKTAPARKTKPAAPKKAVKDEDDFDDNMFDDDNLIRELEEEEERSQREASQKAASQSQPKVESKKEVIDLEDDAFEDEVVSKPKKRAPPKEILEIKDDDEDEDMEDVKPPPKKTAAKRKAPEPESDEEPKKKAAPAKKPRTTTKKAELAGAEQSAEVQAILDSIPLTNAPPPPDRPADQKFNYHAFAASKPADAPTGTTELPVGAPNCLAGLSFCFTGILTTLPREEGQELVKRHGGKVVTAPSSKTSYVVLGENAGPKKLETIAKNKIKTIDEYGLFELIKRLPANGGSGKAAQDHAAKMAKEEAKVKEIAKEMEQQEKARKEAAAVKSDSAGEASPTETTDLWTTKYAPTAMKDICGNKGHVDKLQKWLHDWQKYEKAGFKKGGPDGLGLFRSVIMSGPPGIGKTTAAHLAAKLEGYDVLEYNASDTRSQKLMREALAGVMDNTSLYGYFAGDGKAVQKDKGRLVLIMDEIDGMSGGDRGGVGQLKLLMKSTKIPIICICNDRKHQKLKPLDNTSFEMPFRKPDVNALRSRIMSIAFREGLKISPQVVEQLVAGTNGDMRQIINLMSTWRLSKTNVDFDSAQSSVKSAEKHIVLKPWDIVGKLLSGGMFHQSSTARLNDKMELYFNDFEFTPLMMQENYLKTTPDAARKETDQRMQKLKHLELVEKAASSISDGDLCDAMIHGPQQQWSLLPAHAIFSSVRPASFVAGSRAEMGKSSYNPMAGGFGGGYSFTAWLGNNSKQGKLQRYLRDIQAHMRLRTSGDRNEIRQSYLPVLFDRLPVQLAKNGVDAIGDVIQLMDEYFLNKEHYDEILELSLPPNDGDAILKEIPAATKSKFTREYNSGSHPIPFHKITSTVGAGKVGGGGGKAEADSLDVIDEEADDAPVVEDEVAEDDDDDLSKDSLVKAKPAGKGKKAAAPKKAAAKKEPATKKAPAKKAAKK
ncbi:DNA replication factor C, large subunit [Saitoella complicata NRRL Y-17804]|uniref:Replication factor C subunit 1 n=1 Tax=Saitoella complicata (strain BCRC 22490 / CBS 7301 / JCM 7358 / NBRC 10748 / NRRL Y-17804) TaxID=698492 RepID=A0A0E9NDQ2_SAICN|nr:DNA replication factor C, large subunit [Saitoella complicata NRRL Y-17804]ODQ50707.1 DNA replication factor C, large subunit [Saitoella complicata NRRL Y-17804]GAO47964.1 hypothetical protein G7K_2158-t2 [Saitoella complicata NRRL Y-17804]